MKNHIKRPAMPKSWPVKRRGIVFSTRPNPGPHGFKLGLPLQLVLRDILGLAKNAKEVRKILHDTEILVDGIRRRDSRFPVGIMDIIEIKKSNKYFRIVLDKDKISLIPIDKNEATLKPCKVIGKTKVRGQTQLNLYDGKNILVKEDDYKPGDTVVTQLPQQKIKENIRLEKGCCIYLIGGKHSGDIGNVEDIVSNKITYKREKGEVIETLKKYVFVVGKDKPVVSLTK